MFPTSPRRRAGGLLIALKEELRGRGYSFHPQVLEAWKFSVPQFRSRLFVVGVANDGEFQWPEPGRKRPTVGDAIGDLPVVSGGNRNEVQNYDGPPASALAKSLRKGSSGRGGPGDS